MHPKVSSCLRTYLFLAQINLVWYSLSSVSSTELQEWEVSLSDKRENHICCSKQFPSDYIFQLHSHGQAHDSKDKNHKARLVWCSEPRWSLRVASLISFLICIVYLTKNKQKNPHKQTKNHTTHTRCQVLPRQLIRGFFSGNWDQETHTLFPFYRWGMEVLNETCPALYKDFVTELKTKPRFQITVITNEIADFS